MSLLSSAVSPFILGEGHQLIPFRGGGLGSNLLCWVWELDNLYLPLSLNSTVEESGGGGYAQPAFDHDCLASTTSSTSTGVDIQ